MKKIFLLLTIIVCTITVQAQWEPLNGPNGCNILCSAVKGQLIFAGTEANGLYVSADNGLTWTSRNNGLIVNRITDIAVISSRVFILSNGSMFYSDNDGLTWMDSPMQRVTGLGCNGTHVYITTYSVTYENALFRSSDLGITWTPVGTNWDFLNTTNNFHFAGNKIYLAVGINPAGFYKSSDNGNSFEWVALYNGPVFYDFFTRGNELYGISSVLYRSLDDGENWANVTGTIESYVQSACAAGNRIYVAFSGSFYPSVPSPLGVYYSDDGVNYFPSALKGVHVMTFAVSGNRVLAGAYSGAFYYTDSSGESWEESGQGLPKLGITSFDVSGNRIVAASTDGPVHFSGDGGITWKRIGTAELIEASQVKFWNNLILAGKYYSPDDGLTWDTLFNQEPVSFAVYNNQLYAGTNYSGVFRLESWGGQWAPYNSGAGAPVFNSLDVIGSKLYASTSEGLFVSDGSSAGWVPMNNGFNWNWVMAVGGNADNLLASNVNYDFVSNGTLYHSTNQGNYWSKGDLDTETGFIACFEKSGETIFAGTKYSEYPVYVSDDNGNTWSVVNTGFPIDKDVTCLRVSNGDVFASCSNFSYFDFHPANGIYKRKISDIIAFRALTDTVVLNREYASTAILGITSTTPWTIEEPIPGWFTLSAFSGDDSENITVTATSANPWEPTRYFTLTISSQGITRSVVVAQNGRLIGGTGDTDPLSIRVWPNPVSSVLNITAPGFTALTLSDISGKLILKKNSENMNQIDLSGSEKGVYYLNLSGEKGSVTRKIIIN